jgi:hypothetical protein
MTSNNPYSCATYMTSAPCLDPTIYSTVPLFQGARLTENYNSQWDYDMAAFHGPLMQNKKMAYSKITFQPTKTQPIATFGTTLATPYEK